MAWHAEQATLVLLKTAWPRRMSPSFKPASNSSRWAFCLAASALRRAYSDSASFCTAGLNFARRGLMDCRRRGSPGPASVFRAAIRARPTLSSGRLAEGVEQPVDVGRGDLAEGGGQGDELIVAEPGPGQHVGGEGAVGHRLIAVQAGGEEVEGGRRHVGQAAGDGGEGRQAERRRRLLLLGDLQEEQR